jgi:hypothetical protein
MSETPDELLNDKQQIENRLEAIVDRMDTTIFGLTEWEQLLACIPEETKEGWRDRHWGPGAVRLRKEWVALRETQYNLKMSRPEGLDSSNPIYLVWKVAVEKARKESQEKWAEFARAIEEHRRRNRLPPLDFPQFDFPQ